MVGSFSADCDAAMLTSRASAPARVLARRACSAVSPKSRPDRAPLPSPERRRHSSAATGLGFRPEPVWSRGERAIARVLRELEKVRSARETVSSRLNMTSSSQQKHAGGPFGALQTLVAMGCDMRATSSVGSPAKNKCEKLARLELSGRTSTSRARRGSESLEKGWRRVHTARADSRGAFQSSSPARRRSRQELGKSTVPTNWLGRDVGLKGCRRA